jgi:hypothetical protein
MVGIVGDFLVILNGSVALASINENWPGTAGNVYPERSDAGTGGRIMTGQNHADGGSNIGKKIGAKRIPARRLT